MQNLRKIRSVEVEILILISKAYIYLLKNYSHRSEKENGKQKEKVLRKRKEILEASVIFLICHESFVSCFI